MLIVDDYFKSFPARKKVAEFMVRNGLSVRNGRIYCNDLEISISELSRSVKVNRKIVYYTIEMIENSPPLKLLFKNLRSGLKLEEVAPLMGWEVLEIEGSKETQKFILARVLKILEDEECEIISLDSKNMYGEVPSFCIVVDKPLPVDVLIQIREIPGIKKLILKTPEKDKHETVCALCEVNYCSRRISTGS